MVSAPQQPSRSLVRVLGSLPWRVVKEGLQRTAAACAPAGSPAPLVFRRNAFAWRSVRR